MTTPRQLAQASALDEAARALKRSASATREALQTVRRVQAELNGIEVETIETPKTQEVKGHGTTQEDGRLAA